MNAESQNKSGLMTIRSNNELIDLLKKYVDDSIKNESRLAEDICKAAKSGDKRTEMYCMGYHRSIIANRNVIAEMLMHIPDDLSVDLYGYSEERSQISEKTYEYINRRTEVIRRRMEGESK